MPHSALKKCKSKNRFRKSVDMIYSIWCILSWFITNTDYCIRLNRSNMIVHNLGRKKREHFTVFQVFHRHITVKCDFLGKIQESRFCFCTNATRISASKCHRNTIEWMICRYSEDVIAGPERLQKISCFVSFLTLQSSLCKFKLYKNTLALPKNRQKRQIA